MTNEQARREIDSLDYYLQNHTNDYGEESHTAMMMAIKALEQEPKTGHWIEYTRVLIPEPINKWEQAWKCSECGYGEQDCEDGSAWVEWKFCPLCGSRMVEPQESEVRDADSD